MKGKIFTLLGVLLMSVSVFAQDHHWPLTADANDAVGTLHGTATGITYTNDEERGDVAIFDGSAGDSFIKFPSVLNGQEAVTISVWFKQNVGSTWSRIYSFGESDSIDTYRHNGCVNHLTLVAHNPDGRYEFLIKNAADPCAWHIWPGKSEAVTIGEWHHSVTVLTRTKSTLYLDGLKISEQSNLSDPLAMVDEGNVLGRAYWPDADVQAAMSDFRIYNSALSDYEVAALYAETEMKAGEIVGGFAVSDIAQKTASVDVSLNAPGKVYFVMLKAGDAAPDLNSVVLGATTYGLTIDVPTANTKASFAVTEALGGEPASNYVAYLVAEDADGNKQSAVTAVPFRTLAETDIFYHWPLAGDVDEANGSGKNGAAVGATFVDDAERGTVADFTNGYITLPSFINGLDDITIGVWMNMDSVKIWSKIYSLGLGPAQGDAGWREGLWVTPVSGVDNKFMWESTGKFSPWWNNLTTPTLNLEQWYHFVLVYEGETVTAYMDGVELFKTVTPRPVGEFPDTENYLGKSWWPDPNFHGQLSDFRAYSKGFTAQEVVDLYNSTATAVEKPAVASSVKMYPNPATSTVTIAADDFDTIEIYSVLGQQIAKYKAGYAVEVNVSGYQKGMYIVKLSSGNQSVTEKLIIK